MWAHIKKKDGGSWWQKRDSIPDPMPDDWTILEIAEVPESISALGGDGE